MVRSCRLSLNLIPLKTVMYVWKAGLFFGVFFFTWCIIDVWYKSPHTHDLFSFFSFISYFMALFYIWSWEVGSWNCYLWVCFRQVVNLGAKLSIFLWVGWVQVDYGIGITSKRAILIALENLVWPKNQLCYPHPLPLTCWLRRLLIWTFWDFLFFLTSLILHSYILWLLFFLCLC